jgi:hypothetical protein
MSQNVGTDANKLITMSAKQVGILGKGQTLDAQDMQDCFDVLNMMMGEWSEQRSSVYRLIDAVITCDGSKTYTVGVGGTVNTAAYPVRIESAYFTQNGVNYPLGIIRAKEDWIRIALPTLTSFPKYIFMDTDYPLAKVSVWPIPNNTYTVTMQFMAALQQFAYLTDLVNLRPVYQSAIIYNLCPRIAPLFGQQVPRNVERLAIVTKNSMKKANIQIPLIQVPQDLKRSGHFNVLSGQSN